MEEGNAVGVGEGCGDEISLGSVEGDEEGADEVSGSKIIVEGTKLVSCVGGEDGLIDAASDGTTEGIGDKLEFANVGLCEGKSDGKVLGNMDGRSDGGASTGGHDSTMTRVGSMLGFSLEDAWVGDTDGCGLMGVTGVFRSSLSSFRRRTDAMMTPTEMRRIERIKSIARAILRSRLASLSWSTISFPLLFTAPLLTVIDSLLIEDSWSSLLFCWSEMDNPSSLLGSN